MLRRRSRAKCAGEPAAPLLAVVGALLLPLAPISAQAIGQGFELERAGRYDQAASVHFATLRAEPANVSALLGLERVLPPLNRLAELLPAVRPATVASPTNVALRGILLRTYVASNGPPRGRSNGRTSDPHRPACGRAATRLGPGGAGLDAVRADRRDALVRRAVRPQAVRRHGGRARHAGRTPRAGARAGALRRDGARARGGAGMGRCRARVRRSRRPRGRARRARACGPGFERASRRAAARAERRGRGPDRRGTARRGGPPARE